MTNLLFKPIHVNSDYNFKVSKSKIHKEYSNGYQKIILNFTGSFHLNFIQLLSFMDSGSVINIYPDQQIEGYQQKAESEDLTIVEKTNTRLQQNFFIESNKERMLENLLAAIISIEPKFLKDILSAFISKNIGQLPDEFVSQYLVDLIDYSKNKPIGVVSDKNSKGEYVSKYLYKKLKYLPSPKEIDKITNDKNYTELEDLTFLIRSQLN